MCAQELGHTLRLIHSAVTRTAGGGVGGGTCSHIHHEVIPYSRMTRFNTPGNSWLRITSIVAPPSVFNYTTDSTSICRICRDARQSHEGKYRQIIRKTDINLRTFPKSFPLLYDLPVLESVTTWASSGLVCSGLFLLAFTGAEDCWGPRSGTGLNKSAFMVWHEIRCAAEKQPVSIEHSGRRSGHLVVFVLVIPFFSSLVAFSGCSGALRCVHLSRLSPSGVCGHGALRIYRRAATSWARGAGLDGALVEKVQTICPDRFSIKTLSGL